MNDSKALKAVLAGVGGGMVASWAVTRFYRLARRSSGAGEPQITEQFSRAVKQLGTDNKDQQVGGI